MIYHKVISDFQLSQSETKKNLGQSVITENISSHSSVSQVVGKDEQVTKEHRNELHVLESFLLEVQRHSSYMFLSFVHSVTKPDAKFRGYDIPLFTPIYANYYSIYMDPG